ncbi:MULTISPECIES: Rho termination factor N-terminal domain-containing protein [unclassified Micromonospora]|uniref:Rho termination factor N-terminal domain-containing protein n=2 Tax=Micromonospora TaxID=1873 RepID=UPI00159083BF|nr:Rho termination factor N-terminal domain-containing protein [Verrucosispora sp. NA02020]QKW12505.1 Rho termination factor N-terminal domain-containing protein [Verrucosispora sp. NA02020]
MRATEAADPAPVAARLAAMTSRADGTAYLSERSTRELRELAAQVGLRGLGGLRKADLVERIVDATIGYRLDSTALRRL